VNPFSDPDGVTDRGRQLTELLKAVGAAQQVARALCISRPNDNELKLLFGRLEAVRVEIEQTRRGLIAVPFDDIDPKWTGLLPWRLAPEC
jgi:hypothetical protein